MKRLLCFFLFAVLSSQARAYSVTSLITHGCHEAITLDALDMVRLQTGQARRIVATSDQAALIADVPYPLSDAQDFAAAALVLAIVDNDLKGYDPFDQPQLVPITSDPTLQREHCLRSDSEDEPDGSTEALADCAAFMHERVAEALDGLGADGDPDPSVQTSLPVFLTFRGARTVVSLPTYYVRMGQALHALEDSFAHTFRTADQSRPTVALNWIDQQGGVLDEQRDGPGHSLALDSCEDHDALRVERRQRATAAAVELLAATLGPASQLDKLAESDAVIAKYTTIAPGCNFANQWCAAPERKLASPLGCSLSGAASRSSKGAPILVSLILLLTICRRAFVRRVVRLSVIVLLVASLMLSTARADPAPSPAPIPISNPEAPAVPATTAADGAAMRAGQEPGRDIATPTRREITTLRDKKRLGPRFGGQLTVAGAIDHPGAAVALGLRARINEHWLVGLDVDYNAFFSLDTNASRPGALNIFASVVRRYPMTWNRVNLRTTVQAGISTLLFDLYGAPRGSTGPYVGISPLGLDFDLGRALRLVFDPALISLPAPHVTGEPFYYLQYRVSLGLSFGG